MRRIALGAVIALVMAGCGGGEAAIDTTTSSTTTLTTTTTMPVRTLAARTAVITVDGEDADWDGIEGLRIKMDSVHGVYGLDPAWVDVKVAHDTSHLYVLMRVDDDYNWHESDVRLSAAPSVTWAIDPEAGIAMGAVDTDRDASLGRTDIWHWQLRCASGLLSGGAAGDGAVTGGADPTCLLHDENSVSVLERSTDAGENSLLGAWTHTDPTEDAFGTYIFEFSRPLDTQDPDDRAFVLGETSLLALAYWDPDNGDAGWEPELHVVSSYEGWIEVTLQP